MRNDALRIKTPHSTDNPLILWPLVWNHLSQKMGLSTQSNLFLWIHANTALLLQTINTYFSKSLPYMLILLMTFNEDDNLNLSIDYLSSLAFFV